MNRLAVVRITVPLVAGLALLSGCLDDLPPALEAADLIHNGPGLVLTAPNGGEAWHSGEVHPIRWRVGSMAGADVRIELHYEGVLCQVITPCTANDGQFEWLCSACTAEPGDYRIRITDLTTGESDTSDQAFAVSILEVCVLSISAPQPGGTWSVGEPLEIAWDSYGGACGEMVRIDLLYEGATCKTIAEETPNDGGYTWTVTPCADDSSGYALRVTDLASGAYDETASDLTFLFEPCSLALTRPAGGETWVVGEARPIEWAVDGFCGGTVTIDLLLEGELCQILALDAPNDGRFDWIVAQCGEESGPYTVRITDPFSGAAAVSAGAFSIAIPSDVRLIAPNGGEDWITGWTDAITWSAPGASIKLELLHAGEPCAVIAEAIPNTGRFPWSPVPCVAAQEGYTIRVTDLELDESDVSDGPFAILDPPDIALTSPLGGEHWLIDEVHSIEWMASEACGDFVRLELERNGAVCQVISSSAPNCGIYLWTAEQCGLATEGYLIRITDLTTGVMDVSPATFTIQEPCRITLTHPTGGEEWLEGETYEITWNAYGACDSDVRIELLAGGSLCEIIAARTANDGSWFWTAAPCGGSTSGYQIRITDLATGSAAESIGTFQIKHRCKVHMMAPRGGEYWTEGRSQEILWNPTGACSDRVDIELLCDGVVCAEIARGVENRGSYAWSAARVRGHERGYQVRVTDLASGSYDQSASTFSIPEPCMLRLRSPNGGEELLAGSPFAVRWDESASCGDDVRLDLLRDGAHVATITSSALNDGAYSWTPVTTAGTYRLAVTDLTSGESDTSGAFEIRTPVFLRFTASEEGFVLTTNHPDWGSDARLRFSVGGAHWFDTPAWGVCGGAVMLLSAQEDGETSFYPDLGVGTGLLVSDDCTGIEVRIRGAAQVRNADVALRIASDVSATCVTALPIATDCRILNTNFGHLCLRSEAPMKLTITFEDEQALGVLYAIKQVEYIFRGWALR